MKKIKLNLILLIALVPLLTFCGGVRDALEGKKRSEQSDEFLVEKKNPLELPPDYGELPLPVDQEQTSTDTEEDNDIKSILDIDTKVDENTSSQTINSVEELILEKIN